MTTPKGNVCWLNVAVHGVNLMQGRDCARQLHSKRPQLLRAREAARRYLPRHVPTIDVFELQNRTPSITELHSAGINQLNDRRVTHTLQSANLPRQQRGRI